MLGSALYFGTVRHRRHAPRHHALAYRVFYLLLDLAEAPMLNATSRWFGWNRRAWLSFHDCDHGDRRRPYAEWLAATLLEAGYAERAWQFRVLCLPRVGGYVFNPITVVYCHGPDAALEAVLYEVTNTFGERLAYVAPVSPGATRVRQRCDKALSVSPFLPLAGHYDFDLSLPGERLTLGIDYRGDDGQHLLHASFQGERMAWSAAALRRAACSYPILTMKIVAGIHLEALVLWLKGVPLVRREPARASPSRGSVR